MSLYSSQSSSRLFSLRSNNTASVAFINADSKLRALDHATVTLRELSLNKSSSHQRSNLRETKSIRDTGFIEKDIAALREKTKLVEKKTDLIRSEIIHQTKLYREKTRKNVTNNVMSHGASVEVHELLQELQNLMNNIIKIQKQMAKGRERTRGETIERGRLLQSLADYRKKERESSPSIPNSPKPMKIATKGKKAQNKNLLSPYVSDLSSP